MTYPKEKLDSTDPAGWYECDWMSHGVGTVRAARWWDGVILRLAIDGEAACDRYTNFRPLVYAAEPEVIVGDGVTKLEAGVYAIESPEGWVFSVTHDECSPFTANGYRYIRMTLPTFPPRPAPIPPKPEQRRYRINDHGFSREFWGVKCGSRVVDCDEGRIYAAERCERVEESQ